MTAVARQWRVLVSLCAKPQTVYNLAADFDVSKATAQRDIDTLAEVFVVERWQDPEHKQRRMYSARMEARPPP